ncbi:MAG: hypothetical protein UIG52_00505 [Bacteroidales bacterium]|nr:hypothetical protein [Bacteroidales bacterium]
MGIIDELKRIKEEQGLTDYKLGKLSMLYPQNVKAVLSNQGNPLFVTIEKIANALGYDVILKKRE